MGQNLIVREWSRCRHLISCCESDYTHRVSFHWPSQRLVITPQTVPHGAPAGGVTNWLGVEGLGPQTDQTEGGQLRFPHRAHGRRIR